MLYADPADDVLAAVKKKLDGMPLATLPGGNTGAEKPKTAPKTTPKAGGK